MRKNFTLLLLIPGFIVFFACSKHESHPTPTSMDSTANNVYLDPGNVNAIILSDTFRSFNLIQAYDADTGGTVHITARAVINNDTCLFSIDFPDSLRTGIAYTDYLSYDTTNFAGVTIITQTSPTNFSLGFFDQYLATTWLTGVKNNYNGDTIVLTTFDRYKHLLAGTFKATMMAAAGEAPSIKQNTAYVTGSFNTYYNNK